MIDRIGWMKHADAGRLLDQVDSILMQLATFLGLNSDTMSRTFANRFMDIGRHIKRASKTMLLNHAFKTLAAGYQSMGVGPRGNRYRDDLPATLQDSAPSYSDFGFTVAGRRDATAIGFLVARLENLVHGLPVQQLVGRKTQLQQLAFRIHAHLQMATEDLMTSQGHQRGRYLTHWIK